MGRTEDLAGIFEDMATLLEITGADRFRVNAHARAARAIRDSGLDIVGMAEDRAALTAIEGIGPKTADKIREFARTGAVAELGELMAQVPPGLPELMQLQGLGPKTVRTLWQEGGITSIAELQRAIDDGSILALPRMGKKTVDNIRQAIEYRAQASTRMRLGTAVPVAEALVHALEQVPGVQQVQFAGSARRGQETVGDLDILATTTNPVALAEAFAALPGVERVLASGESKSSVQMRIGDRVVQADLRIVPEESFGAALMYFTGSKEHNVKMRERALKMGLTLNEYGLFPNDDDPTPPQKRGVKPVAGRTEEEVFRALRLPWIPPELRVDRGEVADGYTPPRLIELTDIRAELHAHTTASDGRLSILELATMARDRGFHTIAVTDHSQASFQANGLTPERLRAHIAAVHAARAKVRGIRILAGSEVDIHPDGHLDYDDDLLAELDIVVASPHAALKQDPEAATARLLRAIEHPRVHILGHPTGRIIGRREGLAPDLRLLAAAAARHNVALEVNANSYRLDLNDLGVRIALDAGALIAIDCDVHTPEHFSELRYGVQTARRGGLTAERCVNTWDADRLEAWLAAKRKA